MSLCNKFTSYSWFIPWFPSFSMLTFLFLCTVQSHSSVIRAILETSQILHYLLKWFTPGTKSFSFLQRTKPHQPVHWPETILWIPVKGVCLIHPIILAWRHRWSFSEFLSLFPGPCWKHIIDNVITPVSPKISMYTVPWNHCFVKEFCCFYPSLFHRNLTVGFMIFWRVMWTQHLVIKKIRIWCIYIILLILLSFPSYCVFYSTYTTTEQLWWCEKNNEWLLNETISNRGAGIIGIKD